MARPREFEMDEALEGAMQIFWRQGYGATNLPDLLKAMGLTRGSFYKAFGDKRSVYLEALKRYDENNISAAVQLLGDADQVLSEKVLLPVRRPATGAFRWLPGGWQGLGGLVAATCAGFWIGISPPDMLPDTGAVLLGYEISDTVSFDDGAAGFGWDAEEG